MKLYSSTYYLKPTEEQLNNIAAVREAAQIYREVLEHRLPEGPDKTSILWAHRTNVMRANAAIARQEDGTPR